MKFDDPIIDELKEIWDGASGRYQSLKDECEQRCVRWEFTTSSFYSLEPFWFEIRQVRRGKRLSSPPLSTRPMCQYGFDADDRRVVEHRFNDTPGSTAASEKFTIHYGSHIDEFQFDCYTKNKTIAIVRRATVNANKITETRWVTKLDRGKWEYEFHDGRVSRLKESRLLCPGAPYYDFFYEGDRLDKIIQHDGSDPVERFTVIFSRPPKNFRERKAEMTERLIELMVAELKEIVRKFKVEHPDERCYTMVLTPTPAADYLECAFGTEEALDASATDYESTGWRATKGDTHELLRSMLRWNPWDGFHFYNFQKEGLLKELSEAFDNSVLERFTSVTANICTEALRRLDASGVLQAQFDREQFAIGIAGEDDTLLLPSVKKLNPKPLANRVAKEIKLAFTVSLRFL